MCGCETECQTCAELLRMIELERKPAEEVDRLTFVVRAYHQRIGKEVVGVDRAYSQVLLKKEQAYVRELEVGEEIEELSLGWITNASLIIIENITGKQARKTIPSDEELLADKQRMIMVYFHGSDMPSLVIPPGMPQPFMPAGNDISLRCKHGSASYVLTVIPK